MKKYNFEMITLARNARGYSQGELSNLLDISQGTMSKLENDILDPEEYIENISKVLNFPKKFFSQHIREINPSAHHYRKKIKLPKKEKSMAEALMNIIKSNLDKLSEALELPSANITKWDVSKMGSPTLYANHLRELWRIPKGVIHNLTRIVEDNGIIVLQIDFTEELDGLSFYSDNGIPIIFLNRNMPSCRIRLTLAHELGHLGMHFAQPIEQIRDIEKEAFEFASELLVPARELLDQVSKVDIATLANLKRYWKISMHALAVKFYKIDRITKSQYRYLRTQFHKNGWLLSEPKELDPPFESPTLAREMITTHINELEYSNDELSQMLNLHQKDIQRFFFSERNQLRVA